jgi:hypothetical protein
VKPDIFLFQTSVDVWAWMRLACYYIGDGGVLVYMVGRGVMVAGAEQRVDLGMDEAKCWVEPLGEKITYG